MFYSKHIVLQYMFALQLINFCAEVVIYLLILSAWFTFILGVCIPLCYVCSDSNSLVTINPTAFLFLKLLHNTFGPVTDHLQEATTSVTNLWIKLHFTVLLKNWDQVFHKLSTSRYSCYEIKSLKILKYLLCVTCEWDDETGITICVVIVADVVILVMLILELVVVIL
jgi:hypothetical protein